jgi:hypothetical protein
MPQLEVLSLDDNDIGNDGCWAIALAIRDLQYLDTLRLSGNKITSFGIAKLCTWVPSEMDTLDVGENLLKDDSAKYIADMIRNRCPATILIPRNTFTDDGLRTMALAVRESTRLKYLFASFNGGITDVGASYILEAIKTHVSFLAMPLDGTRITNPMRNALIAHSHRLHSPKAKMLVTLLSARMVPRFAATTTFILPTDLVRRIAQTLYSLYRIR